jgi:hypothetical protein
MGGGGVDGPIMTQNWADTVVGHSTMFICLELTCHSLRFGSAGVGVAAGVGGGAGVDVGGVPIDGDGTAAPVCTVTVTVSVAYVVAIELVGVTMPSSAAWEVVGFAGWWCVSSSVDIAAMTNAVARTASAAPLRLTIESHTRNMMPPTHDPTCAVRCRRPALAEAHA